MRHILNYAMLLYFFSKQCNGLNTIISFISQSRTHSRVKLDTTDDYAGTVGINVTYLGLVNPRITL